MINIIAWICAIVMFIVVFRLTLEYERQPDGEELFFGKNKNFLRLSHAMLFPNSSIAKCIMKRLKEMELGEEEIKKVVLRDEKQTYIFESQDTYDEICRKLLLFQDNSCVIFEKKNDRDLYKIWCNYGGYDNYRKKFKNIICSMMTDGELSTHDTNELMGKFYKFMI